MNERERRLPSLPASGRVAGCERGSMWADVVVVVVIRIVSVERERESILKA